MEVGMLVLRSGGGLESGDAADGARHPSKTDVDETNEVSVRCRRIAAARAEKLDRVPVRERLLAPVEQIEELEPSRRNAKTDLAEPSFGISIDHAVIIHCRCPTTNDEAADGRCEAWRDSLRLRLARFILQRVIVRTLSTGVEPVISIGVRRSRLARGPHAYAIEGSLDAAQLALRLRPERSDGCSGSMAPRSA